MVKSSPKQRQTSMLQKSYFDVLNPTKEEEIEDIDVQDDVNEDASWVSVVKKIASKSKTASKAVNAKPKGVGTGTGANTSKGPKAVPNGTADIGAVTAEPKSKLRKA